MECMRHCLRLVAGRGSAHLNIWLCIAPATVPAAAAPVHSAQCVAIATITTSNLQAVYTHTRVVAAIAARTCACRCSQTGFQDPLRSSTVQSACSIARHALVLQTLSTHSYRMHCSSRGSTASCQRFAAGHGLQPPRLTQIRFAACICGCGRRGIHGRVLHAACALGCARGRALCKAGADCCAGLRQLYCG